MNTQFHVLDGEKAVETRARGIDKVTAAASLLTNAQYDLILAIGADGTDEDLFRVIPTEGYSIRVGLKPSVAKYNFKHQKDVFNILSKFEF